MKTSNSGRTPGTPSIHYWQTGSTGPRVLLLMGFGMRGDLWRPQIDGLGADHRLAWLDNRGIGHSPCEQRTWTIGDMARDALSVADALGWNRFHLVGVSMGGMIAQELALRFEQRLQSLSLIATHEGGSLRWLPKKAGLRSFVKANLTKKPEERVRALRTLLYPEAYLETCDEAAMTSRMKAQVGRRAPRNAILAQLSAVSRHRTGPRLSRLRLPTLIVKPTLDVLIPPEASDRLKQRIQHARVLELQDAGHGAIFQKSRIINDALREHFGAAE